MGRRLATAGIALVAGAVLAACSQPHIRVNPPRHEAGTLVPGAATPEPDRFGLHESDPYPPGDPGHFDQLDLVGQVQPGSRALSSVVPATPDLHISALRSPSGNAAISLREDDTPRQRWGRLMIPAERKIIAAFAANSSLGQWLVIVDDVRVRGGVDPIQPTGYRWTRADVETYARCGIPPRAIDPCTDAFYLTPHMWMELPAGAKRGA